MTSNRASRIAFRCARPLLPAVFLIVACAGGGLKTVDFTDLPAQSASPEELVAYINGDGRAITALKGKLGMGLQKGAGEEVKRCSGMLLAQNSSRRGLYLKGYKRLIPTFFTLVSDGGEFWLHIPRDDVVYTGPVEFSWSEEDSLELYLNAGDLFRALFLRPVDAGASLDVDTGDTEYVITVYAGDVPARKLWVERKRFTVVRELYYDGDGTEQLEIQRREYVDLGGRLYPASLVLHDLISGSSVFLEFNSITPDPDIVSESIFRFEVPDGVEVERVDSPRTET